MTSEENAFRDGYRAGYRQGEDDRARFSGASARSRAADEDIAWKDFQLEQKNNEGKK